MEAAQADELIKKLVDPQVLIVVVGFCGFLCAQLYSKQNVRMLFSSYWRVSHQG